MRQISMARSQLHAHGQTDVHFHGHANAQAHAGCQAVAIAEQHALKRGLANSLVLSMVLWTAALYLTLVLR